MTKKPQECCEKCYHYEDRTCFDFNCPCHTPQEKNIVDRMMDDIKDNQAGTNYPMKPFVPTMDKELPAKNEEISSSLAEKSQCCGAIIDSIGKFSKSSLQGWCSKCGKPFVPQEEVKESLIYPAKPTDGQFTTITPATEEVTVVSPPTSLEDWESEIGKMQNWQKELRDYFQFDGVTYKGHRHWRRDIKYDLVETFIRNVLKRKIEEARQKVLQSLLVEVEGMYLKNPAPKSTRLLMPEQIPLYNQALHEVKSLITKRMGR